MARRKRKRPHCGNTDNRLLQSSLLPTSTAIGSSHPDLTTIPLGGIEAMCWKCGYARPYHREGCSLARKVK